MGEEIGRTPHKSNKVLHSPALKVLCDTDERKVRRGINSSASSALCDTSASSGCNTAESNQKKNKDPICLTRDSLWRISSRTLIAHKSYKVVFLLALS